MPRGGICSEKSSCRSRRVSQPTLSLEQQLDLSRALARTVRSRLPLEAALTELAIESHGDLRHAAELVGKRLAAGHSLSDALATGSSRSARMLAATIDIGQLTNRLDATLESWSSLHMDVTRARRRLLVAMIYPILMFLVACVSLSYTIWQMVPLYADAFSNLTNEAPGWFHFVRSARQSLLVGNGLIIAGILMGSIWWWKQRSGVDSHGAPRDPSERPYLHAHSARLAAMGVGSGRPVSELFSKLLPASGGTSFVGISTDASLSQLLAPSTLALLGRETTVALLTLDAGAVSVEQCEQLLQSFAVETERRAELQSERLARWLPMGVSLMVGLFVSAAYVGMIYIPWVTLFHQLTDPIP